MRAWDAERIAATAGAELIRAAPAPAIAAPGPLRVSIDSRQVEPGDLFVGLVGERQDGGRHGPDALQAGAWGVLANPAQATLTAERATAGVVLAHPDPLQALHRLAGAWRQELGARGARVVAITGSTGKTSTKDILAALLAKGLPTASSPENLNTEIGMPLAILAAGPETRALVLEMAMRGRGQIAELTAIAQPDVGVIVNIGPAHLELLGSLENIAAAKAELIAGLPAHATAVVPAGEELLEGHLRAELETITFGPGGDVRALPARRAGEVLIEHGALQMTLRPSFSQAHNLSNLLAAVAAARALGLVPGGELQVSFSAMRGQRSTLEGGVTLIEDCYNANPMSMRAAIDDLVATAPGRRVAVLGDMLELGDEGPALHAEVGRHARESGIELLLAVGPLAAEMAEAFGPEAHRVPDAATAAEQLPGLLRGDDTVLVKASRGVGLERAVQALRDSAAPWAAISQASGSGQR